MTCCKERPLVGSVPGSWRVSGRVLLREPRATQRAPPWFSRQRSFPQERAGERIDERIKGSERKVEARPGLFSHSKQQEEHTAHKVLGPCRKGGDE